MRSYSMALGVVLVAAGCTGGGGHDNGLFGDGEDGSTSEDGGDGDGDGGDGGDGSGDDGDTEDEGGGDGGGVKFDTPDGGDGDGGDGTAGCKKIDFLFVIDNSGSMELHQQNLINNFGPFMDTITNTVEAQDYHVMVVDSDACPTMSGGCMPSSCEDTLGAGQVRACNMPGPDRYLTSSLDPATLKSTFQCLADVGVQGSAEEMPMGAMVESINSQVAPGACNEGFLRNDAILVVTIITDDHPGWAGNDNANGVGNAQQWYDGIMAAKNNQTDAVVVLGLLALPPPADQSCHIAFFQTPPGFARFTDFVDMFADKGVIGNVCEPDYNMFFQEAVGLIDSTCDDYVPPG